MPLIKDQDNIKSKLVLFQLARPRVSFCICQSLRDTIRIWETQSTCPPGTF